MKQHLKTIKTQFRYQTVYFIWASNQKERTNYQVMADVRLT